MTLSLARRLPRMTRTGSRPLTTNEPSANRPAAAQLSRKGLARLHESMAAHVAAGRLPGLVTLVACGDDVHIDAIGTPSFVDDAPLARDAIFRIASLTKPITAAATMSLVEEGLLRLEEPIDELVPELADRRAGAPSTPSPTTRSLPTDRSRSRSEEHTSELQSHVNLVCR